MTLFDSVPTFRHHSRVRRPANIRVIQPSNSSDLRVELSSAGVPCKPSFTALRVPIASSSVLARTEPAFADLHKLPKEFETRR